MFTIEEKSLYVVYENKNILFHKRIKGIAKKNINEKFLKIFILTARYTKL